MQGQIFISYRHASDAWAVDSLAKHLMVAFGDDKIFLDYESLYSGEHWARRLEREVAGASALVMVFDADWWGRRDDGQPDRIHDAQDWVRQELLLARRHRKPVLPVIVDDAEPPQAAALPPELRWLADLQFMRVQPRGQQVYADVDRLVSALRRASHGQAFGWRFWSQTGWTALLCCVLVLAWLRLDGAAVRAYEDAFAVNALAWRARLWPEQPQPADLGLIEIDDGEYRELLGGRQPLDPAAIGLVLEALQRASQRTGSCGDRRPVAINLDLAPDHDNAGDRALHRLDKALLALAACRPLVLACPASVVHGNAPQEDMLWMAKLKQQAATAGHGGRLLFTHADPDPAGLRASRLRAELGLVAADLAAGRAPFGADTQAAAGTDGADLDNGAYSDADGDDALSHSTRVACLCPTTLAQQRDCTLLRPQLDWDRRALAVPFAQAPYSLSGGLLNLQALARQPLLLIGGSFGRRELHAVPGQSRSGHRGASTTSVQAFLAHGALHHAPRQLPTLPAGLQALPWPRGLGLSALVAWAVAAVISAAMLLAGLSLERHDRRLAGRVPAYLAQGLLLLAIPLGCLGWAAWDLRWVSSAATVALVGMLSAGRALLANFEIVLRGGVVWKSPAELWRDLRFRHDRRSAALAAASLATEALLVAACLWVLLG